MLKVIGRRLIMALAAGALTMSGTAAALAAESAGAGQPAGGGQKADTGGGINPLCMLRPQDCMYPPDDDRNGDGNRRPSPDADGLNPMCMLRPRTACTRPTMTATATARDGGAPMVAG